MQSYILSMKKGKQIMSTSDKFLTDIKEIRRRARQTLAEGAVTQNYEGKVEDTIALLNHAVATEIVCILRYKFHAVCATGLASESKLSSLSTRRRKRRIWTFSRTGSTNSGESRTSTRTGLSPAQPQSMSRARIWST